MFVFTNALVLVTSRRKIRRKGGRIKYREKVAIKTFQNIIKHKQIQIRMII